MQVPSRPLEGGEAEEGASLVRFYSGGMVELAGDPRHSSDCCPERHRARWPGSWQGANVRHALRHRIIFIPCKDIGSQSKCKVTNGMEALYSLSTPICCFEPSAPVGVIGKVGSGSGLLRERKATRMIMSCGDPAVAAADLL